MLLEIDPALLDVELRLEVPPGADEAFPHIYGPLVTGAWSACGTSARSHSGRNMMCSPT